MVVMIVSKAIISFEFMIAGGIYKVLLYYLGIAGESVIPTKEGSGTSSKRPFEFKNNLCAFFIY
jgi:hypothetical protein